MSLPKRETIETFQVRLAEVIDTSGMSRSAFAQATGTDRSTLSQLLAPDSKRLPRAETLAAIARVCQVSVDWLLGLSQEGQLGTALVEESVAIEPGAGSPSDARLRRWHAEATGYKIRYVPSTIPDPLKTAEVIEYEFGAHERLSPEQQLEQTEAGLAYSRRPETDIEVCSPLQSLEAFARGQGIWNRLSLVARRAQIDAMIGLLDELYPTFRWFLYDGLRRYSVPLTIFGPTRAALYVGDMYLVLTATVHIRALTQHFDSLIRSAVVQPTETIGVLERLRAGLTR